MKNKLLRRKDREEIRRLTRKYFISQKIKEISLFFCLIISFLIVPYTLGMIFQLILGTHEEIGIIACWGTGLYIGILLGIFGAICWLLGLMIRGLIRDWIESNWEKARERAINEFKRKYGN